MKLRSVVLISFVLLFNIANAQSSKNADRSDCKNCIINGLHVLKVYPKEARGYINIYIELPTVQNFKLSIYDIANKMWIKEEEINARKNYQYNLDVTKLPDGVYEVALKAGNVASDARFTVKH